jgi:hypothetical protein
MQVREMDGTTIVEGEVTYTRKDASTLTVPFANIMRRGEIKVRDYRVFADVSGLFAQARRTRKWPGNEAEAHREDRLQSLTGSNQCVINPHASLASGPFPVLLGGPVERTNQQGWQRDRSPRARTEGTYPAPFPTVHYSRYARHSPGVDRGTTEPARSPEFRPRFNKKTLGYQGTKK